jgi:hypothetical protein
LRLRHCPHAGQFINQQKCYREGESKWHMTLRQNGNGNLCFWGAAAAPPGPARQQQQHHHHHHHHHTAITTSTPTTTTTMQTTVGGLVDLSWLVI